MPWVLQYFGKKVININNRTMAAVVHMNLLDLLSTPAGQEKKAETKQSKYICVLFIIVVSTFLCGILLLSIFNSQERRQANQQMKQSTPQ